MSPIEGIKRLIHSGTGEHKHKNNNSNGDQDSEKKSIKHLRPSQENSWNRLNEVIESDFLISPGDIYPNRKVMLEDTDIKDSTKQCFEQVCEEQSEAFSKKQ